MSENYCYTGEQTHRYWKIEHDGTKTSVKKADLKELGKEGLDNIQRYHLEKNPKYSQMIKEAILSLSKHNKSVISRYAIEKYMIKKYHVCNKRYLNRVLKKEVKNMLLFKRKSSYKLSPYLKYALRTYSKEKRIIMKNHYRDI